jgi:SAM-dependent methyltransferase
MKLQSLTSQRGEIEFRKKLSQQQVEGERIFNDEFDTNGINKILIGRMQKTSEQMLRLKQAGNVLSPYIEIGAERCQRSLVMENEIGASGAAADISLDMLRSCDHYMNIFNKSKAPLRICCDANRLPFLSASVPFVFCYETLHHFPDPTPVLKEIHRVLTPGGHFFFDEEPFKRTLHLKLYKSKKAYSQESLNAGYIRKIFDYFFSERSCNEIEHGIIENDEIPVRVWKQALSCFGEKKVKLHFLKRFDSDLFDPKDSLKNAIAYLFGGGISGLCRKSGDLLKNDIPLHDLLACPSCLETGQESKLIQKDHSLYCGKCREMFPVSENVIFLFSAKKLEELYPSVYHKSR